MRIGHRRGLGLAVALLGTLSGQATAGGITDFAPWVHTIPRVTYAKDYRTGDIYYAPPIPYGHYAKDPVGHVAGAVNGAGSLVHGKLAGLKAKHGLGGHGGLGHGHDGSGIGHGLGGPGHGHDGIGLGGHGVASGLHDADVHGAGHGAGGLGYGPGVPAAPYGTPQGVCAAGHLGCAGIGHGGLGHDGGIGAGYGLGHGGPFGHGVGDGHGIDGGHGYGGGNGLGDGHGHGLGGLHDKVGHLKGLGHGALGYLHGLHPSNKVRYFVGPGGPVPLTPGYVPYINVTRSPRDYFAFPPYSTRAMDY